MMQFIPIQDVSSQTLTALLSGQACRIAIYQKSTGLYLDLLVSDAPVVTGAICLNANRIVRDAYLGFAGDLAFYDLQGNSDPSTPGLGARFVLAYVT